MSWILRLEDQRVLRDPEPPPAPVPAIPVGRRAAPAPPPPPAPVRPDLVALLADPEGRLRRRAALAIGRVGLSEGVPPLVAALADPDPEVRQMVAFALGLLRDRAAIDPLIEALTDPDPLVQGRAAFSLGRIGDARAAAAIGQLVAACAESESVRSLGPEDPVSPQPPVVDAFRLGLIALAALRSYDAIARAVLDANSRPVSRWWPVAYALQRVGDSRAVPALIDLVKGPGRETIGFAARGLGQLREPTALEPLLALAKGAPERSVRLNAIRALGQIGAEAAASFLLSVLDGTTEPAIRLEVVTALGLTRTAEAVERLFDLVSDPWPTLRAAALRALAAIDPETFLTVLSGLEPDAHWSVRASLAETLANIEAAVAVPRLMAMLQDTDQRVIPAVLRSLARLNPPGVDRILLERLGADDAVVRMTAASRLGEIKPPGAAAALAAAYEAGRRDPTHIARAAALAALGQYGREAALDTLSLALSDTDWAVRVRAAELLAALDPSGDHETRIRPAPTRVPPETYHSPELVTPAVSPHVFLDTAIGTIQVELDVLDTPLTAANFVTLARAGFFNGLPVHRVVGDFVIQHGDPRGDSEGGPGYTIRDELTAHPYVRGTVGMALDWRDTGGSQFFITQSPQPHLDGRYTAFGRVIAGMDVVDRIRQWDVIERVRVWDGQRMTAR